MIDRSLDERGVDYLMIEFPSGHQDFTGEGALRRLHDSGTIRIMEILIFQKGTRRSSRSRRCS